MRELRLYPRWSWGARSPRTPLEEHRVRRVVVHHSGQPRVADYRGPETIQWIQRFHMEERGWADIGYHFVIAPDGAIYEGRPLLYVGAHVKHQNAGSLGICVLGDFRKGEDTVPLRAARALQELLTWCVDSLHIPPEAIYPHSAFSATECPGELVHLVRWFRPKLEAIYRR